MKSSGISELGQAAGRVAPTPVRRGGASLQLYERWRTVAAERGDDVALSEFPSGKAWSFRALATESERGEVQGMSFPAGNDARFVIDVLRAWRRGVPCCPLEISQTPPSLPQVPREIAHVKLTSASTGAAKAIVFTPEQLAADARNIVSTMSLDPRTPNLGCISLSHSYGFSNLVLPLVLHGIPLILVPAPLPQVLLNAARTVHEITLPAVPALWRSWFSSGAIPPNTAIAISAGAPLPLELERDIFEAIGLKVHNFYGSSECGGIAFDRPEKPRSESGLMGSALDNVRLSISEGGTLVVEGAAVGCSYWPEPQSTLNGARFETTDLVEIRGSDVFLRGRLTDLINVAGRKVAPEAIETALKAHPAVTECVVFGIEELRGERGELIVACLATSGSVAIPELAQFLSAKLPSWQIPREWWFNPELVPNERGKISRSKWRERFLERRHPSVSP